jgi:hypothetical protein
MARYSHERPAARAQHLRRGRRHTHGAHTAASPMPTPHGRRMCWFTGSPPAITSVQRIISSVGTRERHTMCPLSGHRVGEAGGAWPCATISRRLQSWLAPSVSVSAMAACRSRGSQLRRKA